MMYRAARSLLASSAVDVNRAVLLRGEHYNETDFVARLERWRGLSPGVLELME